MSKGPRKWDRRRDPARITARFWSYVRKGPGCWTWQSSVIWNGYGRFQTGRKRHLAHRFSWELERGPVPAGAMVLHLCHNRRCVRPDHLVLGDVVLNARHAVEAGRVARGERIGTAKLTAAAVVEIRRRVDAGESMHAVSRAFPVSYTVVRKIVRRELWRHV